MEILNVACALITWPSQQGTLLLAAKKSAGQSNGLLYEFPGGKLEHGENAADAIIREIREELDCTIHPLYPLTPVEHAQESRIIRLLPFLCVLDTEHAPIPLEHESVGFFSRQTLPFLPWAPADLTILREWMNQTANDGIPCDLRHVGKRK